MNKKNNYNGNKKNNNRNNNQQNNHGFHGGRGRNNSNRQILNQWNNERILMQRICDGAIVTLLSNAIAATSANNTSNQNIGKTPSSNTGLPSPSITEIADSPEENKDQLTINSSASESKEVSGLTIGEEKTSNGDDDKDKSKDLQKQQYSVQSPNQTSPSQIHSNNGFENPILQTLLASILHNQFINNNRKCNKGTQTIERILTPSPNIFRATNNISNGIQQQQQLINNTFLTSNFKFQGLAKTSSVYFTRGIR